MKAEELDEKFDNNEDVLEVFDLSTLKRPGLENQQVNSIIDTEKIAKLYKEFSEEDRQLSEQGINEYAELLKQEDKLHPNFIKD
ncbi:MAG: hypothetical protein QNJ42_04675 [Crocosphaera sp.]|nr:hypothetical protein [Crocosphaera sp.]